MQCVFLFRVVFIKAGVRVLILTAGRGSAETHDKFERTWKVITPVMVVK